MAGGINKVILIGNLGADPEVRFTPSGQAVANFRIATSESWNDKTSGQKQERTEWHRIVVWGKLAELCGEYLKKGRQCYVEGRLRLGSGPTRKVRRTTPLRWWPIQSSFGGAAVVRPRVPEYRKPRAPGAPPPPDDNSGGPPPADDIPF